MVESFDLEFERNDCLLTSFVRETEPSMLQTIFLVIDLLPFFSLLGSLSKFLIFVILQSFMVDFSLFKVVLLLIELHVILGLTSLVLLTLFASFFILLKAILGQLAVFFGDLIIRLLLFFIGTCKSLQLLHNFLLLFFQVSCGPKLSTFGQNQ